MCALQVLLPPRQPDREVISGRYLQEILGSFLQAEAGRCDHGATGSGAQGEVQRVISQARHNTRLPLSISSQNTTLIHDFQMETFLMQKLYY